MTLNLALTPGEPAGVGPDILIQLAQTVHNQQLIVFADPDMLMSRAKQLNLPLSLVDISDHFIASAPSKLAIAPVKLRKAAEPGVLNKANAGYVIDCLDAAIEACQSGLCQGMVTGPVQKSVINDAGIKFSGHTEYLALKTQAKTVVMMLATEDLRVALTTTHLPLREVAGAINQDLLTSIIDILHSDLRNKFGL